MALKLQFAFTEGSTLEAIVMDATISEAHSHSAEVTEFPVEKGSAVTDNVRAKPVQLRIEGFVSDFPLQSNITQQLVAGAFTQRPSADLQRSQNTLDKLIKLKDQGVLVTITTGIRTYKNMVIQSIDVNREKKVTQGILMSISAREIQVVKTQTVEVVAKESKGQSKQADGPKSSKPASTSDSEQGGLFVGLADGFGLQKILPK